MRIEVSFPFDGTFNLERDVERAVGSNAELTGSGCGCGKRDMSFFAKTKTAATKAVTAAKRVIAERYKSDQFSVAVVEG